jgi:dienelactone hydrolase
MLRISAGIGKEEHGMCMFTAVRRGLPRASQDSQHRFGKGMKLSLGALALLASLLISAVVFAQSAGPRGAETGNLREQEWRIPTSNGTSLMVATVMRPTGVTSAPLVVINHGSNTDSALRSKLERQRFPAIASFFVARGYVVVVPMRPGYSASGGAWTDGFGPCRSPDYDGAGLRTAAEIRAAMDYMRRQSFVRSDRTVIVGHSGGAWGTVALSSLNPPGVSAMIAFAPGRGGHEPVPGGNCAPDILVNTAAKYGATARVPLLWISNENDTCFRPDLVRRMVAAYNAAGGKATHSALGPFGQDGHLLALMNSGAAMWQPSVSAFLRGK